MRTGSVRAKVVGMTPETLVGRIVTLPIRRFGSPGAFLTVDPTDEDERAAVVLLLGPEIPEGAQEGDELEVFVYNDSEGRPLATLQKPALSLGEVTYLRATDTNHIGAFFDWGLPKELLVPFAEQTGDVERGSHYPVGLQLDRQGRLVGTMRISGMLNEPGKFSVREWVQGEAWRNDPVIGLFVIVQRRFVGLVPAHEPHPLSRGEKAKFRITKVLPDGRIELSLRGLAHEEMDGDADRILTALNRPGSPRFGDGSSPDELRELFGLSRKAFKRALGRLLKEGRVALDAERFVVKSTATPRRP